MSRSLSHIAPAETDQDRVDTHNAPAQVNEWPAGVPGVDGGIGLNQVAYAVATDALAPKGADDS